MGRGYSRKPLSSVPNTFPRNKVLKFFKIIGMSNLIILIIFTENAISVDINILNVNYYP